MPAVARIGDTGAHGGVIITGASKTTANGIPVARVGDLYDCPIPGHGINPIVTGADGTSVEGSTIAYVGSKTACGDTIVTGSPNTFVSPV